jgi:hypothetical protein
VSGCGTTITTDQRGYARPQNGDCDVGAYEAVFSRTWDGGDGSWSTDANWTGDERPEEGDHAILASAATVSLDISPSIGDLTISGAGANLAAGAGYSLLLNGAYVQINGSFVVPPFLIIYGDWTPDGGGFDPNGGLVRFNGTVRALSAARRSPISTTLSSTWRAAAVWCWRRTSTWRGISPF